MRFEFWLALGLVALIAIMLVSSRLLRTIVWDTIRHPRRPAIFVVAGDQIIVVPKAPQAGSQSTSPPWEWITSHAGFAYLIVPVVEGPPSQLPRLTLSGSQEQMTEVVAAHNGKGG